MGSADKNECVLIISDTHFPYQHPDTVAFLSLINETYRPDRVIHIGDEVDFHAISFHSSSAELFSPSHELEEAITQLQPLYKMFPKVDVIESNHGALVYRKIKHHGIPLRTVRTYREVLEAPSGWKWHSDLIITLPDGTDCYFHHGKSKPAMKLSKNMSMHTVEGHFHSDFNINYWANPKQLYWSMKVGCLINDKSLAFEYNKTTLDRPLIGCGMIINGQPQLMPMLLDHHGRWKGELV